MPDAFFTPRGPGRFRATSAAVGPWDPTNLHGGPPAALLGRAIEEAGSWPGGVGRVAVDIPRPMPLTDLGVEVRVVRPGRRIEMLEAALLADGEAVMLARGWRIRELHPAGLAAAAAARPSAPVPAPPAPAPAPPAPPALEDGPAPQVDLGDLGATGGYLPAMEWVFLQGGFTELGPARVWCRPRLPLVEGEDNSPLTRVLLAADSGNGLSTVLDVRQWLFINPELTVHLHRYPQGEWVYLDAITRVNEAGIGLAQSDLADAGGPIGRAAQSLLLAPR